MKAEYNLDDLREFVAGKPNGAEIIPQIDTYKQGIGK